MLVKPVAAATDHLRRAVLTKAVVPEGLGARFEYDKAGGDYLSLSTPHPVAVCQAFTTAVDPTRSLRGQIKRKGGRSTDSGILGAIGAGQWFLVNWDLDTDHSNRQGPELAAALADLNATLRRQRARSTEVLVPFPASEVEQLLALPSFENYQFTAVEAGTMTADLAEMYRKVIADDLYVGYREAISAGRAGALAIGLAQLDPTFSRRLDDYPWAKAPLEEYLATPPSKPSFIARALRRS